MNQWPTTRDTLLLKLAEEKNQSAWFEFSRLYEPVIYRFSRGRGLQHADAIELTQRVMLKVLRSADQWTENQPPDHFRGWLRAVAHNTLVNLVTREARHQAYGDSQSPEDGQPGSEPSEQEHWLAEERRAVLRLALQKIRPEFSTDSWKAFERTVLSDESVASVARDMNKTAGAIYAARARIVCRLKKVSGQMLEADA